jgi:hypothetical protein
MTPEHRDRMRLLDTLALLAGFNTRLAGFPDGRAPDVVRVSFRSAGLFVGDAKHADSPHSVETYLRVRRYVCWGEMFLRRPGRRLVVALATPTPNALEWLRLLVALADDVGLRMGDTSCTAFAASTVVEIAYESGLPGRTRLSLENAPQEVRPGV